MFDKTHPIAVSLFREQGKSALEFAGSNQPFEVDGSVQSYIRERVDRFASEFSSNLRSTLTSTITSMAASGATLDEIQGAIRGVYSKAKGFQTARIARTETSKYSNRAAVEAYKQTGYVVAKQWFANPDACEFCQELDGKTIGLDDDFAGLGEAITGTQGGQYSVDFEDVGEPPAHPNCECTILPSAVSVENSAFDYLKNWGDDNDIDMVFGSDDVEVRDLAGKAGNVYGQINPKYFEGMDQINILRSEDPRWTASKFANEAMGVYRKDPNAIYYKADMILGTRDTVGKLHDIAQTPQHILAHEVGHHIYTQGTAGNELIDRFNKYSAAKITQYGADPNSAGYFYSFNSHQWARSALSDGSQRALEQFTREHFADTFAAYVANPSVLQASEPAAFELFRKFITR